MTVYQGEMNKWLTKRQIRAAMPPELDPKVIGAAVDQMRSDGVLDVTGNTRGQKFALKGSVPDGE
jgi:hypothetical protein